MSFSRKPLAIAVRASLIAGGVALVSAPLLANAALKERTGADNPFSVITSGGALRSMVMMDLDGDGDLDAAIFHSYQENDDAFGYDYGGSSIWENTGTAKSPQFTELRDYSYGDNGPGEFLDSNPFGNEIDSYYGHPVTLADLNSEERGLLGGTNASSANYETFVYTRLERASEGGGEVVTSADRMSSGDIDNPFYSWQGNSSFYGTNLTPTAYEFYDQGYGDSYAALAVADLYGDNGRGDIVVVDHDTLRVFRNDGDKPPGYGYGLNFVEQAGSSSPFYGAGIPQITSDYYGAPIALADLDNDGDLDLLMGTRNAATVRVFENTGTASAPQFIERDDPLIDKVGTTEGYTVPVAGDVNSDGKVDLMFSTSVSLGMVEGPETKVILVPPTEPVIRYFESTSSSSSDNEFLGSTSLWTLMVGAFGLLLRRRR
ncbi:MAG: FG-GAP-like repeat-containing protein [Alcanivoracaceae bacterium]|jgi:uncharacterized protein (TIGR03382 family)|nr:FG-GAP-like repeat-containing protein [Alcanivoracaceae bacterium]